MPVEVLPEFTPTMVEIQTEALGLSAPEVEQLITVPMEQDLLNGVPWLDDIRSESVPGLSRIQLIFEPGTDLLLARQVVQERMTQAVALPQVSAPPLMVQPLSSMSRVMMARLSSDQVSPIDMSVIAHWTIRPRLLGVPGVANVSIWGQRDRQLQVQVDPQQLEEYGVSLLDVIETTGNALWVSPLTFLEASTPGTGGFIDTPNQRLGIQHLLPIKTADDLAQVPLTTDDIGGENSDEQVLRLSDVATVVEDHQPLIGDNISGDGDGDLLLVIEKFPDANTLEVTQGVEAALAALAPGLTGIEVDTSVYRPASSIETAVGNVGAALPPSRTTGGARSSVPWRSRSRWLPPVLCSTCAAPASTPSSSPGSWWRLPRSSATPSPQSTPSGDASNGSDRKRAQRPRRTSSGERCSRHAVRSSTRP
jgi:Cu/Ag efflux pump CusA